MKIKAIVSGIFVASSILLLLSNSMDKYSAFNKFEQHIASDNYCKLSVTEDNCKDVVGVFNFYLEENMTKTEIDELQNILSNGKGDLVISRGNSEYIEVNVKDSELELHYRTVEEK